MANNISIIGPNNCSGCRACFDACAVKAIAFEEDKELFYQPIVNQEICVSCGKCLDVCPINKQSMHERPETCQACVAVDTNDKNEGSSGGVFGLLAKTMLSEGYQIYGAAFDNGLKLRHIGITTENELKPLLKSKYIQSNATGIYMEIKNNLKNEGKVLFCGTPCQCNALNNYLGKQYDNLVLVDFVCHGVPSQGLFDKCIAYFEEMKAGKVKAFQFRYKGKGVKHPQSYRLVYEKNGIEKEEVGLHYQSPYYFAFQTHISLRKSCYSCPWARPERCSDITLGDFWGIDKKEIGLRANDGVSMVLANTEKGKRLLNALIASGKISSHEIPYEFAVENNGCLKEPTIEPKCREQFFKALNERPFSEVVNQYMKSKHQMVFDLYYAIPSPIRKIVRKVMDKRMKYE